MLLAMAKVMFEIVSLGLKNVYVLVLDFPTGATYPGQLRDIPGGK